MKRTTLLAASLLVTTGLASGQSVPFDMSTERKEEQQTPDATPSAPTAPAQPAVAPTPAPSAPPAAAPAAAVPLPHPQSSAPSNTTTPLPPASMVSSPSTQPSGSGMRRFLIPSDKLSLNGEIARKQWTVQLTADEARTATQLHVGYQNALVIAPELSRVKVAMNGVTVLDQPVQSSEGVSDVIVNLPADVLRTGKNLISFDVSQRHRTDCTIQSTYELWSEIAPERTFLTFGPNAERHITNFEDVSTIGVDEEGNTRFNIIAPGVDSPAATGPVLRLSQGLAVFANMPNQRISVSREAEANLAEGALNVVVGLPAEVSQVLQTVPEGATVSPTITFVDDQKTGPNTMVVTGPTWQSIASSVESVIAPADRPLDTARTTLSTEAWHYPDAPIFSEAGQQSFAQLGLPTQEFAGRRFRTDFVIGIPSDFYANDYGQARLLLDAAYSAEVLPGSHIDIYVNDNIAATVPITTSGGAILRKLPVPVTMRHFRPGANKIAIEAVLMTQKDAACAPGATGQTDSRFVMFDTSAFEMPRFARIAQLPNLARTAGTSFPYNRSSNPIPVLVDKSEVESLSTAATLLAKLTLAAGRPFAIEPVNSVQAIGERDAMFFGPIGRFDPEVLTQVGLAAESRVSWGQETDLPTATRNAGQTTATFDKWRDQLSGAGWRGQINGFSEWLNSKFDISLDTLRLTPRTAQPITPPFDTSFVIAQRPAPDDTHIWTLATAPTAEALWQGADGLVHTEQWNKVGGEMTLYNRTGDITSTREVSTYEFRETQPFSLANYRLILANWLSGNVLSYAAGLFIMCIFLGIATATLLKNLGRRQ
ncbi:cellulose biosynthesis cyclic di-GMP-binding regulatory protein BcsB [Tianweitania sp. BSSL-BM11]|uniref:Cyclic di-GMP-binding protein n=1 Tax=Tianweitania aestuarii TaxID=2814886 RepID=A0ABS5RTM1_9HYPH|nr:cellulose biosynthesis cyclic di-GMP-binding regulatory protein BcsB [Tianweitania aestuarii]MBS9720393.1 cellulose biosynthesis cyclic di-GMP-binding regulatory protein BcsB [Tianweitania aestuarii]